PAPDSLSFANKTAVVTGANQGLGLAPVQQLAQCRISILVLGVHKMGFGEAAKAAILADPVVHAVNTQLKILVYEFD
ncbi:hypothetical protein B0H14DRAFT_2211629, partial [Mycena olivaceomarginata]